MNARSILLPDGRCLGYAEYGDPAGSPVFYCHGFASSRLEAALLDEAARRQRLRIIAPDRPGYGLSDYQPRRRISDWPDDVAELADALGIKRFAVLGVSGGGPHALACAWKIPARVARASVVCGLGPVSGPGGTRCMRRDFRLAMPLARYAPWLVSAVVALLFRIARPRPELLLRLLLGRGVSSDTRILAEHPQARETLLVSMREALRHGSRGVSQELGLFAHPWSFRLEAITPDIYIWHGDADPVVPWNHARRLVDVLPHARPRYLPGEGHFSVPLKYMDTILRTLGA